MKLKNLPLAARTIYHVMRLRAAAPKDRITAIERFTTFIEEAHIQNPDYGAGLAAIVLQTLDKGGNGLLSEIAADDAMWVEARIFAQDEPEVDRLLRLISRLELIAKS